MDEYLQVTTTTVTRADADSIARALVEGRQAACVQIVGPITSVYRWQGKVETAHEYLCIIKTGASAFADVERTIKQLHPYETPEIIATTISTGSAEYLEWIGEQVGD